jgi:hypothetical protein
LFMDMLQKFYPAAIAQIDIEHDKIGGAFCQQSLRRFIAARRVDFQGQVQALQQRPEPGDDQWGIIDKVDYFGTCFDLAKLT